MRASDDNNVSTNCSLALLPFIISEWNLLDPDVREVITCFLFCKNLLAFIWPIENNI